MCVKQTYANYSNKIILCITTKSHNKSDYLILHLFNFKFQFKKLQMNYKKLYFAIMLFTCYHFIKYILKCDTESHT